MNLCIDTGYLLANMVLEDVKQCGKVQEVVISSQKKKLSLRSWIWNVDMRWTSQPFIPVLNSPRCHLRGSFNIFIEEQKKNEHRNRNLMSGPFYEPLVSCDSSGEDRWEQKLLTIKSLLWKFLKALKHEYRLLTLYAGQCPYKGGEWFIDELLFCSSTYWHSIHLMTEALIYVYFLGLYYGTRTTQQLRRNINKKYAVSHPHGCRYPGQKSGHSGVDTRLLCHGTACSPAHHPQQTISTGLRQAVVCHKRTTAVSLRPQRIKAVHKHITTIHFSKA